MSGNKAMRRALATQDAIRVNSNLPAIVDTTELITVDMAEEMLSRNKHNRPVNWKQVEEYAAMMKAGEFKLTAQGIVIDTNSNLLTGQTRLWAVLLSGCHVYMRVSRGNSPETGRLLDRGRPQSARDLATRHTEKKHAPTEATIARALLVIRGNAKPSKDELADAIASNGPWAKTLLRETSGQKKTKSVLMILGAICGVAKNETDIRRLVIKTTQFAERLDLALLPHTAVQCWGRGAAFSMALEKAVEVVGGRR